MTERRIRRGLERLYAHSKYLQSLAINEYRKLDYHHPHLARTLANIAYVKRLVALELRRKIDAELTRRRTGASAAVEPAPDYRKPFRRLRDEACADLNEAAAIYDVHPNHRGSGTVHLNRGLLHLDNGALDLPNRGGRRLRAG